MELYCLQEINPVRYFKVCIFTGDKAEVEQELETEQDLQEDEEDNDKLVYRIVPYEFCGFHLDREKPGGNR